MPKNTIVVAASLKLKMSYMNVEVTSPTNFLTNPFTFESQTRRSVSVDVGQSPLGRPEAMEIPMSKWSPPPESPIDAARGLLSKRKLPVLLDRLSLPDQRDGKSMDMPTSPLRHNSSWGLSSLPVGADQYRSPNSAIQGRFKCVCGAVFERKDDFYDHHANSCVTNSHICDVCNRGFTRSQDLKQHKMVHSIQTVVCIDCGQKFPRQQSLTRHKKTCRPIHYS